MLDGDQKPAEPVIVPPTPEHCNHGITFDLEEATRLHLSESQVRKSWPRLFGRCPIGCGYNGIYYASTEHYVWGDW